MGSKKQTVDEFLGELGHAQGELIDAVRALVKGAEPGLTEGIKWNAPSYALEGNDIITFNFRTFDGVALIFHTGPKGKDTQTGNRLFSDPHPLLTWLADKRFVIKVADERVLEQNRASLAALVSRWVSLARQEFQTPSGASG